jgi:hypothetical protein
MSMKWFKIYRITMAYFNFLKVFKPEIFVTELFTLSDPIWVGDMGTEAKNQFVLAWYSPFCFFSDDWVIGKNVAHTQQKLFIAHSFIVKNSLARTQHAVKQAGKFCKMTEWSLKIIPRKLSSRLKLFPAYWVMANNYFTDNEWLLKSISHIPSSHWYFTYTESMETKIFTHTE